MIRKEVYGAIDRLVSSSVHKEDLKLLLSLTEADEVNYLHATACSVRNEFCKKRIALRALIEISSICTNSCRYCGLNRYNRDACRYSLTEEQILECVSYAADQGYRTVVLQSGEDNRDADSIANLIVSIKRSFPVAVTLSLGERTYEEYKEWRKTGADRYLLRIESTDELLYQSMHTDRTLSSRLKCLEYLQSLTYQTGSGIMVGFPGQTISTIADDIMFFNEKQFDMLGIGPFIPHPQTPFSGCDPGDLILTLNTLAVTRLVTRYPWMPSTTALGSLHGDHRIDGLMAGANVIMPNFTPSHYKSQYEIYPDKQSETENEERLHLIAQKSSLSIDKGRCDSLLPRRL